MLFGHSEPDSCRQACKKIKKNSFELDLFKEALFGRNGLGGRKVAPGNKSGVRFFWPFWVATCFIRKMSFFLVFLTNNKEKKWCFLCFLVIQSLIRIARPAKKLKKNAFELNLSKEVLFSQN